MKNILETQSKIIEFRGIELEVFFEYHPPEPETNYGGHLNIYEIECNGKDIGELFLEYTDTEFLRDEIEDLILTI